MQTIGSNKKIGRQQLLRTVALPVMAAKRESDVQPQTASEMTAFWLRRGSRNIADWGQFVKAEYRSRLLQ